MPQLTVADSPMAAAIESDIVAGRLLDPYAGDGPIYMAEFYSGTATAVRQMRQRFGSRVHALIFDVLSAKECGVDDIVKDLPYNLHDRRPASFPGDNIYFVQYNLGLITFDIFAGFCMWYFDADPHIISRIHGSFCCETFAFINLVNANAPRDKAGNAITEKGDTHDRMLFMLIELFDRCLVVNPLMLQTIENPEHSSFLKCPIVTRAIADGSWKVLRGSHCMNASVELDGAVYGLQFNRQGGLTTQKDTAYLTRNASSDFELDKCKKGIDNCRMKVPGYGHHVLTVANHTDKHLPGQRLVSAKLKAVIPLGVHDKIFDSHRAKITQYGGHHDKCSKCAQSGMLLRCQNGSCKFAQHPHCSSMMPDRSGIYHCDTCRLARFRAERLEGIQSTSAG